MKPSHLYLWAVPLALMVLACCHAGGGIKDADSQDRPDIVGSWTWVESTGGIGGVTKTAESSGETWTLEFRKDGTYRETRLGEERVGRYTIADRTSIFDHEMRPALLIEGRLDQIIARPDGQRLFLSDNAADGFNNIFVRTR
jgi:hypothetical protein